MDSVQDRAPGCRDPAFAVSRIQWHRCSGLLGEWLVTNGIGGYASSTRVGMSTRRYHGLLVAAMAPPVGRTLLLTKVEEEMDIGDTRHLLGTNFYPGVVYPHGFAEIESFDHRPAPTTVFRLGSARLTKRVFMVPGENTTVVTYTLRDAARAGLRLVPLVNCRDFHSETHAEGHPGFRVSETAAGESIVVTADYPGAPSLHVRVDGGRFVQQSTWYENMEYPWEERRGLSWREDHYSPGRFEIELCDRDRVALVASTSPIESPDVDAWWDAYLDQRLACADGIGNQHDDVAKDLARAGDQFIVTRTAPPGKTILAGYHWFADWGRDTMIALPGLTLATRRFEEARSILSVYADARQDGLLPNRFRDDGGGADYNTVDAALWFFWAARKYEEAADDPGYVIESLLPAMEDIASRYADGTRYGIHTAPDGLLWAGEPGMQLTWMDAKVGDWVVTPRQGRPVEINALWYYALRYLSDLCRRTGKDGSRWTTLAQKVQTAFAPTFWNDERGCLYDVVGDRPDPSIRSNQIIAASLTPELLGEKRNAQVVDVVDEHLRTPYGLRSLSPDDPAYRPHYGGDVHQRDGAYHQGTVWTWPIGHFIDACIACHANTDKARAQAKRFLAPLVEHLNDAGLGTISEIFDGAPPYDPKGCIAQAWSVAEVLRVWIEHRLNEV
jgi:predicted glycogen debranching enzyme